MTKPLSHKNTPYCVSFSLKCFSAGFVISFVLYSYFISIIMRVFGFSFHYYSCRYCCLLSRMTLNSIIFPKYPTELLPFTTHYDLFSSRFLIYELLMLTIIVIFNVLFCPRLLLLNFLFHSFSFSPSSRRKKDD